ncbi:MAG: thioredoxin family protein [bacterium]|nr:thioredoxin family protein [bacterium]
MGIRIIIYGKEGDGSAQAAMTQIRALVGELRADATVQMITDPAMLTANGVDHPPAVQLDGMFVSNGWVPSRNELSRALRARLEATRPVVNEVPMPHKKKTW